MNMIGKSMKIVTDAKVSIIAPKQPQLMLRPCERTVALAIKNDKLIAEGTIKLKFLPPFLNIILTSRVDRAVY
jgi:hypothetical protein